MKAVIYARYSSAGQRDESIEGQIRVCSEYAKANNINIVNEYIDRAMSGKSDDRPAFQRMIKDCERKQFDAVIIYTLDRFARNRYDSAMYKARLKRNGVKVLYATQPIGEEPEGIILESVLEGFAEYYSANLSRNVKRGLKENALKGLVYGGSHCLGLRANAEGKYEIEPEGAKVVKEIFELYANGNSRAKIIRYCNSKGYKTAIGNEFTYNSLQTILRNERYIGKYKYMDVVLEGAIPPILDKELFTKVQSMIELNRKATARTKANEEYLLTTKVFCGHCGSNMVGECGRSESGKMYYYYRCNKKNQKKCQKKPEKKQWLEDAVVNLIISNVLTPENIDLISTKVVEIATKEYNDTSYLKSLEASLKRTESKINNLLDAIESGINTSTTRTRLADLEATRDALEADISKEKLKKPLITKEHVLYWLESFMNGDTNNINYRRSLIYSLVNSIFVYNNDNDNDESPKIVFTFNSSKVQTETLKCSDMKHLLLRNEKHCKCLYIKAYSVFCISNQKVVSECFGVI